MNPYERLRLLAKKQGLSINDVEEKIGLGKNTLYSWKKKVPSGTNLTKVADFFGVTTDYLLGRTDTPEFTRRDERDVQNILKDMTEGLSNDSALAYMKNGGEEIDEEDAELLKASLENVIRQSKLLAKQKFTPKKYRKDKD
nr:MAG TPA: repressor protein [Caudoviricetes sp.]